jgi:hypothetical protein
MLIDRPRQQVLIAGRDVTDRCDSLVYSATDNGGYEIATLGLPSTDRPKKGDAITIRQGLEVAWAGRVAEIADHSQHGRATKTTGCEGLRALLRDTLVQMVYVDRDLSRWGGPSTQRQINLQANNYQPQSPQASPDAANAKPAIIDTVVGAWAAPVVPRCEAWYDAGPGNLIAGLYFDLTLAGIGAGAFASWVQQLVSCTDDAESNGVLLATATPATPTGENAGRLAVSSTRYVHTNHYFNGSPGGVDGSSYQALWHNMAVFGNSGLSGRGPDPQGLYPSDIARHALSQCSGISVGNIVDAIGYIAPHVVYRTPTAADVIIDDMAKLMGWPWGVWEPSTVLGSSPRLDFGPPPTDATAVVTKAECDQLDVTARLGDLYNTCQVTYTDPAGTGGMVTVTLPSAQLSEAGIATRTLPLNMGVGSAAAATTFGLMALALSQISARAAGQATLPVAVRLPGGGSKPACLLRPGLDRLRIVDLVDGGPLFDRANTRRDVFRISRCETTVGKDGIPSTRVELDSGSNLLETLQARLTLAAGIVGAGGLGG